MCKKYISFLILIVFSFIFTALLTSCEKNSAASILLNPPECKITNLEKSIDETFGYAKISFTAENTGDVSTAYSVICYVKFKKGNLIVSRSSAYFGNLELGESTIESARLDIDNHNEYNSEEYTLVWYDANNGYYEKKF